MSLEFFPVAGPATASGVFIPVANLPGLTASELGVLVDSKLKEGRSLFSILKKVFSVLSPTAFAKLGFSVSNAENKPAIGLVNRQYSYTASYVASLATGLISQIPTPTSGTNSGVGKFSLIDIFPAAVKVAAAANTPGAGVLIPSAALATYGAPAYGDLDIAVGEDNRSYLAAFFNYLADGGTTVRAAGVTSGVIDVSRSTPSNFPLPLNATAQADPTTGILAEFLNTLIVTQITYSVTLQTIDDLNLETFDINLA